MDSKLHKVPSLATAYKKLYYKWNAVAESNKAIEIRTLWFFWITEREHGLYHKCDQERSFIQWLMLNLISHKGLGSGIMHTPTPFNRHMRADGPRQANLVLIVYASSEGSGEPAHPRSLARTFAARSYKQWIKRDLQTETQIPGPSEWLGMRSWNLSWRNARRHKFAWRGSDENYFLHHVPTYLEKE